VTLEARQRWQRKLDHLLAQEPITSSAAQRFEPREQIAECREKLFELDAEERRRTSVGDAAEWTAGLTQQYSGDVTTVETLLEAARK
jgi:hypothetical protein